METLAKLTRWQTAMSKECADEEMEQQVADEISSMLKKAGLTPRACPRR